MTAGTNTISIPASPPLYCKEPRQESSMHWSLPRNSSATTRNLVKNRACTGVCQGILNILGNKAQGHRAGNNIVPSGKNSPEKASAHRHLHRRIPTDRRIPRFAHRSETPTRLMAAPAVHLILSLWKQKAHDGKHTCSETHST